MNKSRRAYKKKKYYTRKKVSSFKSKKSKHIGNAEKIYGLYKIKPGKLNALMELYEKEGMEVHKKILGNQIGYFYTEIGPLNEVVHLYGYESLDDRAKRRKELAENEIWQKYIAKAIDLFESQESKILIPANFSNIK